MRNQQVFERHRSTNYQKKGLEKDYSMVLFSGTLTQTITIKNLKLTLRMIYVIENFSILAGSYIPYRKACQGLLIIKFFRNIDRNCYLQRTQTWHVNEKFLLIVECYISFGSC